jgi:cytoskeletal protein CcmA (bactofilin family)
MNVFRRREATTPEPQPATVPTARDPDLGVPPRSTPRDNPAMSLAPKPGVTPTLPTGPTPPSGTAIPPRPMGMPGSAPAAPTAPRSAAADRRTLVVGRGISLQGTVADAERLVVEGTVESQMIQASELSITEAGVFKGEVQVEDAEIAGTFDGTLTARGALVIRATGKVIGIARCRRLSVEEGGQVSGRMEMIGDAPVAPAPRPVPAEV